MSEDEKGKEVAPEAMRRIDEQRDRWADRIRDNITLGSEVASRLDQILVSLSGGALVFSMTFIDRIAPSKLWIWVLVSSWVAFVGCILCVIWANRAVLLSLTRRADELAQSIREFEEKVRAGRIHSAVSSITPNKRVAFWNEIAIAAFLLGIILLGVFIVRNF